MVEEPSADQIERFNATEPSLLLGLNAVTRALEHFCRPAGVEEKTDRQRPLVVLTCEQDIQPASIFAHLPALVALASQHQTDKPTLLVALPKGSHDRLCTLFGINKLAAFAIVCL